MRASVVVILFLGIAIQAQAAPKDFKRVSSLVNCTMALSDLRKMNANDQATMYLNAKSAVEQVERRLAAEVYRRELKKLAEALAESSRFPAKNLTVDLSGLDFARMNRSNKELREDILKLKALLGNLKNVYHARNHRWFRGRQTRLEDARSLQDIMVMTTQLFQLDKLLQIHERMLKYLLGFDVRNLKAVEINDSRRFLRRLGGKPAEHEDAFMSSSLLPEFFLWHFTFAHNGGWHPYAIDSVTPPGLLHPILGPATFLENHGQDVRAILGELKDTDRDGIVDAKDADIDGDGIPNNLDLDDDGDGVLDSSDVDHAASRVNDNDNSYSNDSETSGGFDSPGGDSF